MTLRMPGAGAADDVEGRIGVDVDAVLEVGQTASRRAARVR